MIILLMGPQGSGKGTVGEFLSQRLNIPLIDVGSLLRTVSLDHPKYEEITTAMKKGELVLSLVVASLIKERISQGDCVDGYILDGWGRNMENIQKFNPDPDKVVVLNISRDTSMKRISGRRICDSDGKSYNINTLPTEELAKCKGNLIQRPDDTEEAVNKRLDIYYSETAAVIEFFRKQGKVVEVDAEGLPPEVCAGVESALGVRVRDTD